MTEFQALKIGEGLTPKKMAAARVTMALMGEVIPAAAAQRLLDDVADLGTVDGTALEWALKADPIAHNEPTLDARRVKSGVPENTAKDRERRAVLALYERWSQAEQDWASSVFTAYASQLPTKAQVRFGSVIVEVHAFFDEENHFPVVLFERNGPSPKSDFLMVRGNSSQALVIYGAGDFPWRMELWLPTLGDGDVRIARVHHDHQPIAVRIEQTAVDGRAIEEKVPGANFNGETVLLLRAGDLQMPCVISWDWEQPEAEHRPKIVFPDEQS